MTIIKIKNTFISIFPQKTKYVLLVMLENPQVARDLIYNYRARRLGTRNEAGGPGCISGKCKKLDLF